MWKRGERCDEDVIREDGGKGAVQKGERERRRG